jgi:hypothetical protein
VRNVIILCRKQGSSEVDGPSAEREREAAQAYAHCAYTTWPILKGEGLIPPRTEEYGSLAGDYNNYYRTDSENREWR